MAQAAPAYRNSSLTSVQSLSAVLADASDVGYSTRSAAEQRWARLLYLAKRNWFALPFYPSLLPAYKGLDTHARVLADGFGRDAGVGEVLVDGLKHRAHAGGLLHHGVHLIARVITKATI
mgnify:CR=1 FL=1